jgi:hypothetical protein
MFQHAADIGASSPVTLSSAAAVDRFHDGFGPGGNIDLERSAPGD